MRKKIYMKKHNNYSKIYMKFKLKNRFYDIFKRYLKYILKKK